MPNKALRILIADEQHFQRMKLERLFNQLGYYCVGPAQSLEELLTLIEYSDTPFDVVVINASLSGGVLNLGHMCLDNPQVRHALIYDAAQSPPIPAGGQHKVQVSAAAVPDLACIQGLMASVDRRQPFVGTVISVR